MRPLTSPGDASAPRRPPFGMRLFAPCAGRARPARPTGRRRHRGAGDRSARGARAVGAADAVVRASVGRRRHESPSWLHNLWVVAYELVAAAAASVPMRTLQEWLGHRDFATTLIYADYQPGARETDLVDDAFSHPVMTAAWAAHAIREDSLFTEKERIMRDDGFSPLDDQGRVRCPNSARARGTRIDSTTYCATWKRACAHTCGKAARSDAAGCLLAILRRAREPHRPRRSQQARLQRRRWRNSGRVAHCSPRAGPYPCVASANAEESDDRTECEWNERGRQMQPGGVYGRSGADRRAGDHEREANPGQERALNRECGARVNWHAPIVATRGRRGIFPAETQVKMIWPPAAFS